jgi:hypothetical protein
MPNLATSSIFPLSSPLPPKQVRTVLFRRRFLICTLKLLIYRGRARSSKFTLNIHSPFYRYSITVRSLTPLSAWDNADFRAAVKATGKTSFIIGGIVTDVCTAFLALSLRAEGYTVFANVEASGALSELASTTANRRMEKAGVHLVTLFAIVGDLMRSWSTFPNPEVLVPFMNKYFPIASMLGEGHNAAMNLTSA